MTSTPDSSTEVERKVTFGLTLQCVRVGMERVRVRREKVGMVRVMVERREDGMERLRVEGGEPRQYTGLLGAVLGN